MAARDTGYECEFVGESPKRSECPICLLVLREPHQVTCCGKIFCQTCINEIRTRRQPCPACKEENFDCYPDKGLKQELYNTHVFCNNKKEGCKWQGELRELDNHLNLDPIKEKQLVGCGHTKVECLYCSELSKRATMKVHQDFGCFRRPATCDLCKEFKSTYEEVTNQHKPECKCRPVECPNSCGVRHLQHQYLEEHVSRECPLSLVECEFSDAGCGAKIQRQDLPSHLRDEVVTHLSLLATENRKLKRQLQEQDKQLKEQLQEQDKQSKEGMKRQAEEQASMNEKLKKDLLTFADVPPFDIIFDRERFIHEKKWLSKPFYSHSDGYRLRLQLQFQSNPFKSVLSFFSKSQPVPDPIEFHYFMMDSASRFLALRVTAVLLDDGREQISSLKHTLYTSSNKTYGPLLQYDDFSQIVTISVNKIVVYYNVRDPNERSSDYPV